MNWHMSPLLLTIPVVIFLAVLLVKDIRNSFSIRAGKRAARKAEKARKAELTRLTNQMKIGDSIFRTLCDMWKVAGAPSDRKVWRISNCNGVYRINVSTINPLTSIPTIINRLMVVEIDFRRPKNQEVYIKVEPQFGALIFSTHFVSVGAVFQHLDNVAHKYKIFKA